MLHAAAEEDRGVAVLLFDEGVLAPVSGHHLDLGHRDGEILFGLVGNLGHGPEPHRHGRAVETGVGRFGVDEIGDVHHHQIGGHRILRLPVAGGGSIAVFRARLFASVGRDIEVFRNRHSERNQRFVIGAVVARPPHPCAVGLSEGVDHRCAAVGVPIDTGGADQTAAPRVTAIGHLEFDHVARRQRLGQRHRQTIIDVFEGDLGWAVVRKLLLTDLDHRQDAETEIGVQGDRRPNRRRRPRGSP